jgi:hypothetical protein
VHYGYTDLKHYTPGQQRDINLVRLYIQAMTLSDLSTYDGTMIREEALQGVRGSQQKVRIHWPRSRDTDFFPTALVETIRDIKLYSVRSALETQSWRHASCIS